MPSSVPRRTILIIEDHRDFADSLAEVLRVHGHRPVVCYDGASGVRLAELHRPHVIVLDIAMPKVSGYDVARKLRSNQTFDDTVIVAVTGHATDDDRKRAQAAGFDLHCRKPI